MSNSVYINRVGAFLPGAPIDNETMESVLGQINGHRSRSRAMVLRSNGIKSRHYAIDPQSGELRYTNAQMTAAAIRRLEGEGFSLDQLQTLSCGTSSPDQLMPGHGVMVHGELGGLPCEVNSSAGICTAGIAALNYAYMSVACGNSRNAVATGSELASTFMMARNFSEESELRVREMEQRPEIAFEKDFLRWMLSDGAGALLLQDRPNANGLSLRIEWLELVSHASRYHTCMYCGAEKREDGTLRGWREYESISALAGDSILAVKQDVKLLNDAIVRATVEETLPAIIAKRGLRIDEIDHFLPHLSSEFFRPRLAAGLERIGCAIPQEKWFTNLSSKGNTGSAAIYIILDELFHSGRLRQGEKLLCFVPESGRFSSSFMLLTVV